MSYEFLNNYTIPLQSNGQTTEESNGGYNMMHVPQGLSDMNYVSAYEELYGDYSAAGEQYQNVDRFKAPGRQGGVWRPEGTSRSLKRKYDAGPGRAKKKVQQIAETTADGKLVIFYGRDESYPDELNTLIHPMACDLCKTQMNSLYSAKDHYESKVHDRNLTVWLTKNFTEKGLSPPEVKRFNKQGPAGPDAFHCELCDLKLTSLMHANQHYAGRKHRLVANKVSKPSGTGYYNAEGKWVRTGTKATVPADDDRFSNGDQSKHLGTTKDSNTSIRSSIDSGVAAGKTSGDAQIVEELAPTTQLPRGLHCSVCKISATSATQMSMHLAGAKHRKKLKTNGVETPLDDHASPPFDNVLSSVISTVKSECDFNSSDLSMYRTPSGAYYCKTCNITLCHISALQQHLAGKRHIKNHVEEKARTNINNSCVVQKEKSC